MLNAISSRKQPVSEIINKKDAQWFLHILIRPTAHTNRPRKISVFWSYLMQDECSFINTSDVYAVLRI